MVPLSIAWCHSPSHGATLHRMVPLSIAWCHSPSHGATLHRMVPLSIAWCHSPSHGATLHRMVPLSIACCYSPLHGATLYRMVPLSTAGYISTTRCHSLPPDVWSQFLQTLSKSFEIISFIQVRFELISIIICYQYYLRQNSRLEFIVATQQLNWYGEGRLWIQA